MSANDAMSTVKLRRYDLDRIRGMRFEKESNWEVIKRLLDEYEAGKLNGTL